MKWSWLKMKRNKREKEIEILERLYPDDREVDIIDVYMDNLQLAHNLHNKNKEHDKQKHSINISEDFDNKIHMRSNHRDYFK